jgi:hypothetical protein
VTSSDNRTGWIEVRHVRCGKPNCRCRTGPGHGPYLYRVWRDERGRRRVRYLGPVLPNGGQQRDEGRDTR